MKAIILAAGRGRRLASLTKDIPKCLIQLKERSIIERCLDRLKTSGIKEVVIVVGYKKDKVINLIGDSYNGLKIKYIENKIYDKTNCIYSLWLAKEEAKEGFIVINSDTLFDENILKNLVKSKYKDAAVVDDMKIRLDEDAMKVTIENGVITEIAKETPFENTHAHAIGLYKFSSEGANVYFEEIEEMIKKGIFDVHHMVPMNKFVKKQSLNAVSTNGLGWIEIDTPNDLKNSEVIVELIEQEEKNIRSVEDSFKLVPIKEVLTRRSVRSFKENDSINRKDVMTILEAVRWAPSAKNLQPLEYIIVDDPILKGKLAEYCEQIQPAVCPVCILVVGDLYLAGLVGKLSSHQCTTKERGQHMFIYMDAAAAIENLLLTATSLSIDSLWISSFKDKKIAELFDLPAKFIPLAVICLGHRNKPPFSPPKRELRERIYLNKFEERHKDFSYLEICKKINEENGEYADNK